jgi:formate hydrogenlyase transcriptional activator
MLARHFAQRFAQRMGRRIETIPTAVMDALVRYPWPGNIREMQNVIERAVILSPGPALQIPAADLQPAATAQPPGRKTASSMPLAAGDVQSARSADAAAGGPVSLADAERDHILSVVRECGWVLGGPNGAAARLAMKRTTLQSKMKKLGISRPR